MILLGIIFSATFLSAQYIQEERVPVSRHGRYLMYGGQKLSTQQALVLLEDVYGTDLSSSWESAVHRFVTGRNLMISFGAVTFTGASLLTAGAIWYNHYYDNMVGDTMDPGPLTMSYAGVLTAVVGVAGLCAGTVVYMSAVKKLDSIVRAYNYGGRQRLADASLSIGAQRNGFGLAVIF